MRVRNHLWQLDACMTAATRIPEQKETVYVPKPGWLLSGDSCAMDSRRVRKVAVEKRKVFISWFLDFKIGQVPARCNSAIQR